MPTEPHIFSPLMYIAHLTQDFKHRGSTTTNETKAAVYVRRVLVKLGVPKVEAQRFRSGVKLWRPYILCLVLGLLGAVIYPLAGVATQVLAAFLSGLAIWWMYRELNFDDNPVRRVLPVGNSQNIIGTIPSQDEPRAKVVLVGHLDSGQTPVLFSTAWTLPLFVLFSTLATLSLAANAILYLGGAISGNVSWYEWSWIGTMMQGIALIFAMEAELSPYTQGANDNASSVGVIISLAQCVLEHPLRHTEVWTLLSGCEEVGCYGMINFLRAYGDQLKDAYFINLEGVGCGDIHYAKREGVLGTCRSDPRLLSIADKVSRQRPDLGGRSAVLRASYTETGVVAKNGLSGITILTLKHNGLFNYMPYWHQGADVFENLDEFTLHRVREFVWEIIQEIDQQVTGEEKQQIK